VSPFSFNNEVCRLNQANCEIQSLVHLMTFNKGKALNGEIKRLSDVAAKISDISDEIQKINKTLEK
jgi:hypothetical protein